MKKFLEELLKRNQEKKDNLNTALVECENKEERQSIQSTIAELDAECREIQSQLAGLENAFNPLGTYGADKRGAEDTNMEYRKAFMNLVVKGTPIPAELRATTGTADAGSVIPTHLVNTIIEKMDDCGMLLRAVTKTSFKAGVVIPTSSVKPVASWVSEGATSEKQKKGTGKITFNYFKLRCEVAINMEVGTMAIEAFEAKFVENVANAMVIAIEQAIINGEGTASPKGILTETPETGKAFTVAGADKLSYALLCDMEGAVPTAYEGTAVWLMSKQTFMKFIGMVDSNKQPIARVNYGINGKPERTLLGRPVACNPYMGNYADTVAEDTKFACIVDLGDYILNTVYDMGIQKKQDWDTEDLLTKAVMSVDGKLVNLDSLIVATKTAA